MIFYRVTTDFDYEGSYDHLYFENFGTALREVTKRLKSDEGLIDLNNRAIRRGTNWIWPHGLNMEIVLSRCQTED